jgi:hypothetical protein
MDQTIDRAKVKDPAEVSGWGVREGSPSPQDFSDIARRGELNVEFEPGAGTLTLRGRADGSESTHRGFAR